MKKISLTSAFAAGLLVFSLVSCNDAENSVIENRVYIAEADAAAAQDLALNDGGASVSLFARLAKPIGNDVTVKIGLNDKHLTEYNGRNQTEYESVPATYVSYPSSVTIPAGSISAEIRVDVNNFQPESGVDYAIPICLTESQGLDLTGNSSNLILTLSSPLIQKAPAFYYSNSLLLEPANSEWGVELSSFTLEWMSRVTNPGNNGGYSVNNQAIFSAISSSSGEAGSDELYIRFGDLVYSRRGGSGYLYNFLQVKAMGSQFDTGDPNDYPLQWGQWYHFAITFNGADGVMYLYQDGQQVGKLETGRTTPYILDGMNMFSSGMTYFRDYVEMAQLRMWKTVRTQGQIEKFMHKEVKYNDPNLVFYIPMSEGDDNATVLKDVTGNGHDMSIGNNGSRKTAMKWTEYNFTEL